MGIDAAIGISGNAMMQWQQRVAAQNNRMAHEQFMAIYGADGLSNANPSALSQYNMAPQDPARFRKHMQRYSRDCEYCGSTGSITDHGKGLMKCGNCGAS